MPSDFIISVVEFDHFDFITMPFEFIRFIEGVSVEQFDLIRSQFNFNCYGCCLLSLYFHSILNLLKEILEHSYFSK